ncbi:MAG: alpha-glucan family phosphorylase [Deltaproteobacteria bacterium]|nr:alpha-glucan family phosphorylase [Deltaproteobacteria bacterium]
MRKFFIKPEIPPALERLHEMAFNIWSCWDVDAQRLFHRLDPVRFREVNHNPVELLYTLSSQTLDKAASDKGYLYELEKVYDKYKAYMAYEHVPQKGDAAYDFLVAYICMEYGLHESFPIYSGGLAVLAGDTLKAASDMGIPMVSFGLLYKHGYFRQRLDGGQQREEYPENNWFLHPVREVFDDKGAPVIIQFKLKEDDVHAKLWRVEVGRVTLYLLDTNIHQNASHIRAITNSLYDADRRQRLTQELVLGKGSVLAMRALKITPDIYHLNEGHTAFVIWERFKELMQQKGCSYEEARHLIRHSTVFTTHTPVIEGNEHFAQDLVMEYLAPEVKDVGLTMAQCLALGEVRNDKQFWLPAYALRHASHSNGVSKIHAAVSRGMWKDLFPGSHEKEYPIDAITNGVHLQSWLSLQMTEIFDRYIGIDYLHAADQADLWQKIDAIPDGEIWNAHRRRKEQVIGFIRRTFANMSCRRGYFNKAVDVEHILNPDYLTIGFARRFTPYKRAGLIFSDPERLAAIVLNHKRPVQFVFSGKAHPADQAGKDLIRQVFDFINKYPVEHHMLFLENYDMNIARHIVQGVDVWLNTPKKPMEASGTSGIKAGINGVLNFSILDGWWPEAYNGRNGWAIRSGCSCGDPQNINDADANELYSLLEREITETYYSNADHGFPLPWERMMKESIKTVCSGFNMHRAMREYVVKCYRPEIATAKKLRTEGGLHLKKAVNMQSEAVAAWDKVYIKDYFTSVDGKLPVSGQKVHVDVYVFLGDVDEKRIAVEALYCRGEDRAAFQKAPLTFVERYSDKIAKYSGSFVLVGTGEQSLSVRFVPADPFFAELYPEFRKWKS